MQRAGHNRFVPKISFLNPLYNGKPLDLSEIIDSDSNISDSKTIDDEIIVVIRLNRVRSKNKAHFCQNIKPLNVELSHSNATL